MSCCGAKETKNVVSANKMVIVNGVTAVGKSTLYNNLFKRERYVGVFKFCVSHTTRNPRAGETNGVEYHFVTVEQFEEMIKEELFIEYTKNHGNYYGTSVEALEKVLESSHAFLDIDYKGSVNLKQSKLPNKMLFLLIVPPHEDDFIKRLRARGTETEEQMNTRICTAEEEMKFFNENKEQYDNIIVNDEVERATDELDHAIWKFLNE